MSNPYVSIFSPDKIIKDLQWDSLLKASRYAHGRLLDVGCGKMLYKSIFLSKIQKYTGIDMNNHFADIKQDFLKAKLKKLTYDTVLCTQVLEHTPEPQRFLNKIYKILRKKGVLILTVPFTGALHEIPRDYFRYTKYALEYMLKKSGFNIIYISSEGNWISSIGQEIIFYLEPSFNRYLLKYPKRLLQCLIQILIKILSRLPERFTMSEHSVINYLVVAQKVS